MLKKVLFVGNFIKSFRRVFSYSPYQLPHQLASSHALPVPIGKTIATAMKRTAEALGTTQAADSL
jgi:hypothetical protein